MSYISDYKHGCMSDEEYRFHAQRENAQDRDEREHEHDEDREEDADDK